MPIHMRLPARASVTASHRNTKLSTSATSTGCFRRVAPFGGTTWWAAPSANALVKVLGDGKPTAGNDVPAPSSAAARARSDHRSGRPSH